MDQDFDERLALDLEQGVMLWCIRAWVAGLRQPDDLSDEIARMVECLGAPGAAPCLDGFMVALSRGATRKIGIACTRCTHIARDEQVLLDVMGLAQHGRPLEALMLLRGFVTSDAARAALRSAECLGAELALAGWFLAAPETAVSHYAMPLETLDDSRPADAVLH